MAGVHRRIELVQAGAPAIIFARDNASVDFLLNIEKSSNEVDLPFVIFHVPIRISDNFHQCFCAGHALHLRAQSLVGNGANGFHRPRRIRLEQRAERFPIPRELGFFAGVNRKVEVGGEYPRFDDPLRHGVHNGAFGHHVERRARRSTRAPVALVGGQVQKRSFQIDGGLRCGLGEEVLQCVHLFWLSPDGAAKGWETRLSTSFCRSKWARYA